MPTIPRPRHLRAVRDLLRQFPVVAVTGARQVGKTTLARLLREEAGVPVHWFDLELPSHLQQLADPELALRDLQGLVVLDEVQRQPDLFPLLRALADRSGTPARFLLLGSASPHLVEQSAETLAGRIAYHRLRGFSLDEIGIEQAEGLWLRGGYPASYLAPSDADSYRWRQAYVQTFLERDLPTLGSRVASPTLRRFWTMLAHYHGQPWNGSELGRAFGVSHTTVRRYLDLLTATFVLHQLAPWHENVAKRQVKSPKVYLADSGILHALLGLETREQLLGHPKVGASWEGFALGEVLHMLGLPSEQAWFWSTHGGAELDLLVFEGGRRLGFEFKRASAPGRTRSMRSAIDSLGLDELTVVFPGKQAFPMAEGIRAVPLAEVVRTVW